MLLLYKFSVLCFLFRLFSFFVLSPMLPVSVDSLLMIALSEKQKAQHWKLIEKQHKPHQALGELIHDLLPGL
jgi:hypothetical protein